MINPCKSLARACALLAAASSCQAQVSTAAVRGTLEDSSGARIVQGEVRLINTVNGSGNTVSTDSHGGFALPGILPGVYVLQVECEGFAPLRFNGLVLNVADVKAFRIRMRIGTARELVSVDASGLAVSRDDAAVTSLIGRQFVAQIPLNGRSFQDLIAMTPGVVNQSPQAAGAGDFGVNGQRSDTNQYMVDGVSANIGPGSLYAERKIPSAGQYVGATALGTTQGLISIDALQEFRALGSSYTAAYGRTPGGQFTLLTRSGTSTVHGTAYAYLRNSYYDAGDWFAGLNGVGRGTYFYQQDVGGTLGLKVPDRLVPGLTTTPFLFGSYEELHVRQPLPPLQQYVPDGGLAYLSTSEVQRLVRTFPYGNDSHESINNVPLFSVLPGIVPFNVGQASLPSYFRTMSYRADETPKSGVSSFFRFGQTSSSSQTRQLSALTNSELKEVTATGGVNAQLSSWANHEIVLGYADTHSRQATHLDDFGGAIPANLANLMGVDGAAAEAYVRISGIGESYIRTDAASNALKQWNLRDTMYLQRHGHLISMGLDERRLLASVNPAERFVRSSFLSRDDVLRYTASNAVAVHTAPAYPLYQEFSAFAQDAWKVSRRLNASLGVRWDLNPAPTGRDGRDAYTVSGDVNRLTSLALAPRGTRLWRTDRLTFAPRVGLVFAARDTPGQELVIRAGGGIFFDTANQTAAPAFNAAGFSAANVQTNVPLPLSTLSFPEISVQGVPVNALAYAFPSSLRLPYTAQWNVALEQAFGRRQTVSASYVAAAGERLLVPLRQQLGTLPSRLREIITFPSGSASSYQSLQLRFQRSVSPGLTLFSDFVWSHSIDVGSTSPLLPLARGDSDLDIRRNFQMGFSWNQHKVTGSALKRNALNGWGFDGRYFVRSAYAVTPVGQLVTDPVTGEQLYGGVNLIPGRPRYRFDLSLPGVRAFNGGPSALSPAFVLPVQPDSGDQPRNLLRGFGAQQLSLAIRRDIRLYDRITLQLRAESFNVTNSVDFGYISPHLTDELFGQPTLSLGQSFGQNGSLYQPGGPRSIQWMFRVNF